MLRFCSSWLAFSLVASAASAQCGLRMLATGQGIPGTDYAVTCSTTWDPDGPGPQLPRLILGGFFNFAGDQIARSVVAFEPTTGRWQAMDSLPPSVQALAVLPGGLLVAGGSFLSGAECLMQWNGSAWAPFAGGGNPTGGVVRLAVASNGDLVAALRNYTTSLVFTVYRLAGGTWQALGTVSGSSASEIAALLALPGGDLVVGGRFTAIGGAAAAGIARWNGTAWSAIGSGTTEYVTDVGLMPNGDLVAGGAFTTMGGIAAANVARWNGAAWSALGTGTAGAGTGSPTVLALLPLPGGDLVAGGQFASAGGVTANKVARWNGVSWSALGAGIQPDPASGSASSIMVYTLQALPNGEIVAGGLFDAASGRDASCVARFDGTTWGPLGAGGIGRRTSAVAYTRSGDLLLGGAFRDIDGAARNGVARWDGVAWHSLGTGLALPGAIDPAAAYDILVRANGDVVVGGDFATAGGIAAPGIAAWDGAAWRALGTGLGGAAGTRPTVHALTETAAGDLIVGGSFATAGGVVANNIARWNGSSWSALGGGVPGGSHVAAVAALANGHVLAAAATLGSADTVQLWNGSAWQTIGTPTVSVFNSNWHVDALLALPNGDVLAGGDFTGIDYQPFLRVARWSGGAWQPLGGGIVAPLYSVVRTLARMPGGDVIAGGYLPIPGPDNAVLRWDGSTWTSVVNQAFDCSDLAIDPHGEVAGAGSFFTAGGVVSAYLGRIVPTCAAVVVDGGAGCKGSGGLNALAAASPPWLGATFDAIATGMPASGLAFAIYGFATVSTPLAAVIPQGGPGCSLLVRPDLLVVHTIATASLTTSLAIPNAAFLAGVAFHHQVTPLEVSPAGAFRAMTATNRLTLKIGSF